MPKESGFLDRENYARSIKSVIESNSVAPNTPGGYPEATLGAESLAIYRWLLGLPQVNPDLDQVSAHVFSSSYGAMLVAKKLIRETEDPAKKGAPRSKNRAD